MRDHKTYVFRTYKFKKMLGNADSHYTRTQIQVPFINHKLIIETTM